MILVFVAKIHKYFQKLKSDFQAVMICVWNAGISGTRKHPGRFQGFFLKGKSIYIPKVIISLRAKNFLR
jgi:hypothetical protein